MQPLNVDKSPFRRIVAMLLVAAAASFTVELLYTGYLINSLPRSMQGESVIIPWAVCVAGYAVAAIAMPWLLSILVLKSWRSRLEFLVMLGAMALLCEGGCSSSSMLFKAWNRGL